MNEVEVQKSLDALKRADAEVEDKYSKDKSKILANSILIQQYIENVVSENQYSNCIKGFFGAILLDLDTESNVGNLMIGLNSPPLSLLSVCRLNSETCTRSMTNRKHGLSYDTCPAVHARERLIIRPEHWGKKNLVWIEGGATRKDGKMTYANMQTSYPCIRCLSYSMMQNVHILAYLNKPKDSWNVSLHDVESHIKYLLMKNTFEQKE